MRLTVGPLPPAVYWRRRALVLGSALLVIFMIAQACMAVSASPGSQASASPTPTAPAPASPTPAPTESPPPEPEPEPEPDDEEDEEEPGDPAPADAEVCTDDEIVVTAEASRTTFPVGDTVTFTIRIAHAADRPCYRDVGGGERELSLVRGTEADPVWSSRDCAEPTGVSVLELSGGIERTHEIAFVGRSTARCEGPAATGDRLPPGEYSLFARLGTALSEALAITLT